MLGITKPSMPATGNGRLVSTNFEAAPNKKSLLISIGVDSPTDLSRKLNLLKRYYLNISKTIKYINK